MPASASALITGITGQDGSFLAELLLEKGYAVTGMVRPGAAADPLGLSEHLREHISIVEGDLLAPDTLLELIGRVAPAELYHLAAPSFVPVSWKHPRETMDAIAGACAAVLEAVRDRSPQTRVFVPASGAIFGDTPHSPQREDTPCRPTTPYAIAKLAAHQLLGAMRVRDGLHASSGILFNHESERRPLDFVTRRITHGAAAIALGLESELTLGSLESVRDWSFAGDVMRGAWSMLQQEQPGDYVLASGIGHTVGDFARAAFACVSLDSQQYLREDSTLLRPPEVSPSVGDPSKARERLGWQSQLDFQQLVERMVQADLRALAPAAESA